MAVKFASVPAPVPMFEAPPSATIRLSEVIGALSYALDITEGQPEGHAARTCMIGMRLAEELQLSAADRSALFYALLLKDLGCSSNSAKMCYLFGADDRTIKRDLKTVDWPRMTSSLRFVHEQVAPHGSPLERLMKIASMALQGPSGPKKLVETRCERGADIARQLGFPEATARAILDLDEHWDGKGHPQGLRGEQISLLGRIAGLAQTVEVFQSEINPHAALAMARERSGRWFDPQLVSALATLDRDVHFWYELNEPRVHECLSAYEPQEQPRFIDQAGLDRVAEAFAQVVDAKSPWTHKHSEGVAAIAVSIARELGFPQDQLRLVRRAGLLHDIGKLGVSNLILDKPGKLTDEEFGAMRKHPEFTLRILDQVTGFADIAEMSGAHHEKLNGRGYHRGIPSGELPITARLLTVADIFEALSAARPYRDAMPTEKVLGNLRGDAGTAICGESFAALEASIQREQFTTRLDAQMEALDQLMDELSTTSK